MKLIRHHWVKASRFHDLSESQVFDEIRKRARGAKRPVVLFDLDSTLYEVGPRTHRILQEWCESPEAQANPVFKAALGSLRQDQVGYSLKDTLRDLGLDPESADARHFLAHAKPFWAERFFSSAYLKWDRAYPGAPEFARELWDMGLEVVYLTGRDEPGMGDGTRDNLVRDGFPWDCERTHLYLKPNSSMPDMDHKVESGRKIARLGELVASFENEPANIMALGGVFPNAMHIFIETVFSDHEAAPGEGLYRIRGFSSVL